MSCFNPRPRRVLTRHGDRKAKARARCSLFPYVPLRERIEAKRRCEAMLKPLCDYFGALAEAFGRIAEQLAPLFEQLAAALPALEP